MRWIQTLILVPCLVLCLSLACENSKDKGKADAERLGATGASVNTGGTPHATTARIDPDGTVHLVAESQPATK